MFVFFLGQARQTATKNIHFIIIHVAQTTDTDEHDQSRTVGGSQRHQRLQARTHKRDDQDRHRPDRALRIRIQDLDTGRQERGNQGLHAQSPILDGRQHGDNQEELQNHGRPHQHPLVAAGLGRIRRIHMLGVIFRFGTTTKAKAKKRTSVRNAQGHTSKLKSDDPNIGGVIVGFR